MLGPCKTSSKIARVSNHTGRKNETRRPINQLLLCQTSNLTLPVSLSTRRQFNLSLREIAEFTKYESDSSGRQFTGREIAEKNHRSPNTVS